LIQIIKGFREFFTHPIFEKHNYLVDQKALQKFLKIIVSKSKKLQKIKSNHYYHKSTKSVSQNITNLKELNKKRKYASPKKNKTASAYTYSNQKLSQNIQEPEGVLFYRHSERRQVNLANIIYKLNY